MGQQPRTVVRMAEFFAEFSKHGVVKRACDKLSISRATVYGEWMPQEAFRRRFDTIVSQINEGQEVGRMDVVVRFHRTSEGVVNGISTNAAQESEFIRGAALEMARLGKAAVAEYALKCFADVCCSLRGYKSDVVKHTVTAAGEWLPEDVVDAISKTSGRV